MYLHIALQEEKFKYYFNQLCHTVNHYEHAISMLRASIRPLLKPHMEDMLRKIAPGLVLLTWTSMNIDGYLHKFKQVRQRCWLLLGAHPFHCVC